MSDAQRSMWRSTARVALGGAVEALLVRERERIAQAIETRCGGGHTACLVCLAARIARDGGIR